MSRPEHDGPALRVLNFSHPLSGAQIDRLGALAERQVQVDQITLQVDHEEPLGPQALAWLRAAGLGQAELSGAPLLVVPPGYAPAASALLAALHGLLGHFPTLVRVRPVREGNTTSYEVAELVDLQALRDQAREGRARPPARPSDA